jgi:transcriptional regulator with XRE-family HTH domain
MAKTKDALRIIDELIDGDAELQRMVAEETVNAAVAQVIYDARKKAGMTQAELADAIGTRQPVIARLENAEYEGHSLSMLNRIAQALNLRLTVQMTAQEPQVDNRRFAFQTLVQGLRRRRGLSIDQLAQKTEIDREEILAIERNPLHLPDPRALCQLAEIFEIPTQRFLQLAGLVREVPKDLDEEICRFAACSESLANIGDEERELVDRFARFLRGLT